jgi:hypothetical protein
VKRDLPRVREGPAPERDGASGAGSDLRGYFPLFLAGVNLLALAMTADGSVDMQMA